MWWFLRRLLRQPEPPVRSPAPAPPALTPENERQEVENRLRALDARASVYLHRGPQ